LAAVHRSLRVVREHTREYDFAAELDESCIGLLLPSADLKTARHVAERLRWLVRDAFCLPSGDYPDEAIEVRVGVSAYPSPAETPEALRARGEGVGRQPRRDGGSVATSSDDGSGAVEDEHGRSADETVTLLASAIQARERERARIARELHDGPAQTLAIVL